MHRRGLLDASSDPRVGADLGVRSLVFDVLVALLFVALGLLLLEVFTKVPTSTDRWFVVLVNLPLALRRRFPRAALLLAYGFGLAQIAVGSRVGMHDAGLLYALYSAVGATSARFGLVALGLGVLTAVSGAASDWWIWVDRQLNDAPGLGTRVASLLGALVLVGSSWALGRRLYTSRIGAFALADRADRAEREQQQQVALAAAAERTRIAREMHDVIAHGLSVMVVQADAAGFVLDTSPAEARAALAQISATGRDSMAQMRNLLGLLREGDTARTSTPGLADLTVLVAEAERAGARVTLDQPDLGHDVSALVALTAYRVVQEGLTNARKHGGTDVAVVVAERTTDAGPVLSVTVDNPPAAADRSVLTADPGHGLVGLRERVAAVEGTLTADRQPDGTFRLAVELPLG